MSKICIKVRVKGIVQGVGFRPFVYNLALKNSINGWVNNDDKGVNILLYGTKKSCDDFLEELKNNPPKLSRIDSIEVQTVQTNKTYDDFQIIESVNLNNKSTIISPDIAICDDCIDDINDESNFRYNYALTNCTNCGPRYSIIKTIPYDRCNTSMAKFLLCEKCQKEYKDPTNRRYHAQPVACEKCGPQIKLYDNQKNELASNIEAIKMIANLINSGKIAAIKGMGGFHLVCDATNQETIKTLREKKNRPTKPFAVMFKSLEDIKEHTTLSKKEKEVIISKEKPIVIVNKNENRKICEEVASNINRLGVMIAYTPLHILLFRYLNNPIIATSANLKDEPIIKSFEDISSKLSNVVDYILDFNREIINACDDSIVQVINDELQVLRNARGYAPTSFKIEEKFDKKVLALGANQKSSISIGFENNIISSPYIGDLNSIVSMEYFLRTVKTFKNFYDFEADLLICDKHPNYETTKWAKEQNKKLIQIQHHYAHVLSTMAEHKLDEDILAFAFDGTGYGDDGNIWGGEVFIANRSKYDRVYHFDYFKLLGGEKAVKEPRRVALSLLFDNFSLDEILNMNNPCVNSFSKNEIEMFYKMWQKGLNAPLTSSMGRVFDAISSFAGILQTQTYEGETGLQIEKYYDESTNNSYEYEIKENIIKFDSVIKEIVLENNKKVICTKFINTISKLIVDISKKFNLKVVLTGGVFQNKTLLEKIIKELKNENIKYYFSSSTPLNDQGISIGQLYFKNK